MKKKRHPQMTISQKVAELNAKKKKKVKGKVSFFYELKEEMKKVSWTTKEELVFCTKIVLGAIFALGLGIYIVDLCIRFVIQGIGHFVK